MKGFFVFFVVVFDLANLTSQLDREDRESEIILNY